MVCLTNKASDEIKKISGRKKNITIIPCCADLKHFNILDKNIIDPIKTELGIDHHSVVIGYLGSIGKIKVFNEFLKFCDIYHANDATACVLIVSNELQEAREMVGKAKFPDRFIIVKGTRSEVPKYLNIMDFLCGFYLPTYSRIATSPTKFGEAMGCGIPILSNTKIGDLEEWSSEHDFIHLVSEFNNIEFNIASSAMKQIKLNGRNHIRQVAKKLFNLETANDLYRKVYLTL